MKSVIYGRVELFCLYCCVDTHHSQVRMRQKLLIRLRKVSLHSIVLYFKIYIAKDWDFISKEVKTLITKLLILNPERRISAKEAL